MATRGRLEGRITIPAGGWGGWVDDSGGAGAASWTVPAGEYFLSTAAAGGVSLLAALATALNAAAPTDTLAVTLSAGEGGTGKVSITSTGIAEIVWADTDLRNLLGFEEDLAADVAWTGFGQARALWLPDCAFKAPSGGAWRGWRESDFLATEVSSGHLAAWMGRELQASELSWPAVSRARTWMTNETTDNASWEKFARDCLWGLSPWGTAGGPIRFHPDADVDAAFCTYSVPNLREIKPPHLQEGWAQGPWQVALPRLLVAPAYAGYGA